MPEPKAKTPEAPYVDSSKDDRGAAVFVYAVWGLLLAAALWYSALYGFNVPYHDEWGFVDQLSGSPITLEWLWQAYGDHRLPLAKPIWLFWIKLTNSFRTGVIVNIIVLGLCALGMIRAARRLRGQSSYADAFFPLVMLQIGQGLNFLWSYQISEMLPAFLECAILLIVVTHSRLNVGWAILLGALLVLLSLAGPGGLPFALAAALALLIWAVMRWRGNNEHKFRDIWVALLFSGLTTFLIGLYFYGFKGQSLPRTADDVVRGALEFLSTSFGAATKGPSVNGIPTTFTWWYFGVGVIILISSSMLLTAVAWFRNPSERWRAISLFLILGSGLALGVGMGLARGPYGPGGALSHWYVIFAFPTLCAAYFAWLLYAPATLCSLVQMCLVTLAFILLPLNVEAGKSEAFERGNLVRAFERDLTSGMPPIVLAQKYGYALSDAFEYAAIPGNFEHSLRQLHRAGIGPFQSMRGPFIDWDRRLTIPLTPARTNDLTWNDGTATCTGTDPYLIFALKAPVFVSAVRLTFQYPSAAADATCEFYWCDTRRNGFTEAERYQQWRQPTQSKTADGGNYYRDIVINDWIDRIRIDPDNKPCVFKLIQVELLVPEGL